MKRYDFASVALLSAFAAMILFSSVEPVAAREQRIGLFVGIDKYQNKQYKRLSVAVNDVKAIAERLDASLDRKIELHDEAATYQAIEKIFTSTLPEISRPGDTVFIVWSGHGDQCPDDDGDEEDGLDEFLCPYDVDIENPETYVLDDKMFDWFRKIGDRNIVLILDACYSIGMQKDRKTTFDFLADEIRNDRRKATASLAILASSSEDEISYVHRSMKYSVFTYYLLDFLDRGTEGDIRDAYESMKPRVIGYIESAYRKRNVQGPSLHYPPAFPRIQLMGISRKRDAGE